MTKNFMNIVYQQELFGILKFSTRAGRLISGQRFSSEQTPSSEQSWSSEYESLSIYIYIYIKTFAQGHHPHHKHHHHHPHRLSSSPSPSSCSKATKQSNDFLMRWGYREANWIYTYMTTCAYIYIQIWIYTNSHLLPPPTPPTPTKKHENSINLINKFRNPRFFWFCLKIYDFFIQDSNFKKNQENINFEICLKSLLSGIGPANVGIS